MSWNIVIFLIGLGVLSLLSYLFRESYMAIIPLFGIALFVILWPLYEKLRSLQRIAAEFSPNRAKVAIESNNKAQLKDEGSAQEQVTAHPSKDINKDDNIKVD